MSKPFIIHPDSITEGLPITVEVLVPFLKNRETLTVKNRSSGSDSIQVPIKEKGEKSLAEFSLYKAGTYSISLNDHEELLQVYPHKDLSFLLEFGILAFSVLTILGGLILWNRKKRERSADGST